MQHSDKFVNGTQFVDFEKELNSLYEFMKNKLAFSKEATINIVLDEQNSMDVFGKTAMYSPSDNTVTVFASNRHSKDVLRSVAHEIIHHNQNCTGKLSNLDEVDYSDGYAQRNEHMRKLEEEAYLKGNIIFRDWEDNKKNKENLKMENKKKKVNEGFGRRQSTEPFARQAALNKFERLSPAEKEELIKLALQYAEEGDDPNYSIEGDFDLPEDEMISFDDDIMGYEDDVQQVRDYDEEDMYTDEYDDWGNVYEVIKNKKKLKEIIQKVVIEHLKNKKKKVLESKNKKKKTSKRKIDMTDRFSLDRRIALRKDNFDFISKRKQAEFNNLIEKLNK